MPAPSRRRTRDQLLADTLINLQSPLSCGSKVALLDHICWTWSELDGKYQGCRWWSRNALTRTHPLRHEHVVPRRVLIGLLLAIPEADELRIRAVFDLCIGAVVTRAEDQQLNALGLRSRMPDVWDGTDPFARYRAAGIVLVETPTENPSTLG